jgi:putative ABC transport system ATP-binding protein
MINKGSYSSLSSKIDNNLLSNPMNFNSVENRNEILLKISEDSDKKYNNNAITLRNIHKTYLIGIEGVPALRGVSLKIRKGEFLIIFGTSGGGKTTMLNIIGTIDAPSRGDVTIESKIIKSNTTD